MNTPECQSCAEYLALSRREFLTVGGSAAIISALPAWLPRVAFAQDACTDRDVVIAVYLRGAADGLTLCVPYADDAYYAARPTLNIPRPDSSDPHRATDLDGFFGFPPAMLPLLPAYQAGHLLIAHATGSMSESRSHFDAQRYMEIGHPDDENLFTGWLGRHILGIAPMNPNAVLRALGIGFSVQQSLIGAPLTIPVPDLTNFGLDGNPQTVNARTAALHDMYSAVGGQLGAAAITSQQVIDLLHTIDFTHYSPGGSAVYPTDAFGKALRSTAALIKADVGVEAVAIDVGGWDTHGSMGPITGTLAGLMTSLSTGLAAFHSDMFAGNGRNITVIVMSEFGRRVQQNVSLGADHGHGNCMFVLGNHIAGGRVLRQWPGLAPENLFQGLDLDVTIDFRDILSEIVQKRLGNSNLADVFPSYTPNFRGVTTSCGPASGDMNCDGVTDGGDVAPFVQALTNPSGYAGSNPSCNPMNGDINADGSLSVDDVQPFVDRLVGP